VGYDGKNSAAYAKGFILGDLLYLLGSGLSIKKWLADQLFGPFSTKKLTNGAKQEKSSGTSVFFILPFLPKNLKGRHRIERI